MNSYGGISHKTFAEFLGSPQKNALPFNMMTINDDLQVLPIQTMYAELKE